MSYQPALYKIIDVIESSSLCTVPNFLAALLGSYDSRLQAAASATKSPQGMSEILKLMIMYQMAKGTTFLALPL
jgi:hypothetical protein